MGRKIEKCVVLSVLVLFALLVVLSRTAPAEEAKAPVTIKGTVTASEFDEDGKPTDVVITAGEGVYEVEDGDKELELLQLIDTDITVEGDVTEEEGKKTIDIHEYTIDQ